MNLATAAAPVDRRVPMIARTALFRSTNLQILLVEDDAADAYLIGRALAGNPKVSQVVLAKDGVEALELIEGRDAHPDLAIVDLHMPRMNGFDLLTEFSLRDYPEFPSIVLTSSSAAIDILRSWKRGAVKVLTKRYSIAEMSFALDHAIDDL